MDVDGALPPAAPQQQPTPAATDSSAHPPAGPRHVSSEAFLAATCVAWIHLQPAERKAIRASCRAGRLQHDSLLSHLRLTLGATSSPDGPTGPATPPGPDPHQLRSSLHGVLGRGARLQSMAVRFTDSRDGRREAQMLAVLEVCCACPITALALEGAVPLSGVTAAAVDACCPQLSALRIEHDKNHQPSEWEVQLTVNAAYHLGCVQLLTLCGPRLRELRLLGVHRWQALSYMALNRCTALVSLTLQAGWRAIMADEEPAWQHYIDDPATELHLVETVAQLKTLRSLDLCINLPEEALEPDLSLLRPNAICLMQLSALTALTHLRLILSECYEHAADSYTARFGAAPEGGAPWAEVQEAHRTSLLSALRCMPQLQHLHCPTLWLAAGDALPFTALTSLAVAGVLPPPLEQPSLGMQPAAVGALWNPTQPAGGTEAIALPPQLRELALLKRTSPRALALLQPPPSLNELDFNELSFGTTDVTAEGRLRAEAVDAVAPAVQLLLRFCGCCYNKFIVGADSGSGLLQPREDSPDGHVEWIRQLKGLTVCGSVLLDKIELSTGDLCCLAQTLPGLTGLELLECSFPVAALPILRGPMLQLAKLEVDFQHCGAVDRGTLEAVLLQLCCPQHGGAAPLKHVRCGGFDAWSALDIMQVRESVLRQLASLFGVTGAVIEVWS